MAALVVCCFASAPIHAQEEKGTVDDLNKAFLDGMALAKKGMHTEGIPLLERAARLAPSVFGPEHPNTGAILQTLGKVCYEANEIKKSIDAYTRCLQIREKDRALDPNRLLDTLVNLGESHRKAGNYKEAEALLLRAIATSDEKLGKDHPELSTTLNNLAVIYFDLGKLKEAEPLILRGLKIREAKLGKDHPDLATGYLNLAAVHQQLGKLNDAREKGLYALQLLEARFGKDHIALATPLNNVGQLFDVLGRYSEAETYLLRSLQLRERHLPRNHPDLISSLSNLGNLYIVMQRFAESEAYFNRALAIAVAEDKQGLATANVLGNVALFYHMLGRMKEAEDAYRRALAIREARLGKDHLDLSTLLTNLGGFLITQSRYEDAEPLLRRGVEIAEKKFGRNHRTVGAALSNLGSLSAALAKWEEAERLFARSVAITENALDPHHPDLSNMLLNLGRARMNLGRLDDADAIYARIQTLRRVDTERLHDAAVFQMQANLRLLQGRPREALDLLNKSMAATQSAIDSILTFSSQEAMHAFVMHSNSSLAVVVSMARDGAIEDGATVALDWTLRRKGIVFDAMKRFRQFQDALPPGDPLLSRLEAYRGLKQKLADAALQSPMGKEADSLQAQMSEWQKELQGLEADLNKTLARKLSSSARDTIGVEAVRKKLAPYAALIEFLRCPLMRGKEETPHYVAFVLKSSGSPQLIDLGPAAPIDKAVAAVRQEFTDFQDKLRDCDSDDEIHDLEKAQEKVYRKTSAALHALLFAPLRKALGEANLIYLAPEGDLNRVPFEALVDEEGKYLVERFQFAYLSSGRDLLREEATPAMGTLVFANPDFRLEAGKREEIAEKVLGGKKSGEFVASRGPSELRSVGWKALPGAAAEARDIQKAIDKGNFAPVKVYQGPEALEDIFKRLPAPRVLHLATHGFFVDHDPDASWKEGSGAGWARGKLKQMDNPLLRSGIVLAGANTVGMKGRTTIDDGWVTAEEIALLDLRGTELVVLSACQTGLGDTKAGEGVSGLRWAFLYAGAQSLVTSLFEVPDNETRELMKHFYARLPTDGKLAALQHARQTLIQQRRASHGAAHPFFWASFVLVGSPK